MRQRRLAWGLTLPLVAGGGISAHVAAYALVTSHHHSGSPAHAALLHWHAGIALCLALAAVAAAAYAVDALRGPATGGLSLWAFALLPPVGFVVQEHLEHLLEHGQLSHTVALDPAFVLGLLLQLPFAAAAYLVARALVTVAVTLIQALGRVRPQARVAPTSARFRVTPEPTLTVANPVALGHGQRAPPDLLPSL